MVSFQTKVECVVEFFDSKAEEIAQRIKKQAKEIVQ